MHLVWSGQQDNIYNGMRQLCPVLQTSCYNQTTNQTTNRLQCYSKFLLDFLFFCWTLNLEIGNFISLALTVWDMIFGRFEGDGYTGYTVLKRDVVSTRQPTLVDSRGISRKHRKIPKGWLKNISSEFMMLVLTKKTVARFFGFYVWFKFGFLSCHLIFSQFCNNFCPVFFLFHNSSLQVLSQFKLMSLVEFYHIFSCHI